MISLRKSLREYFLADINYDGSVMASNFRHTCYIRVLGDLPYDVSQTRFADFLMYLPFNDVSAKVEACVAWVERQQENNQL